MATGQQSGGFNPNNPFATVAPSPERQGGGWAQAGLQAIGLQAPTFMPHGAQPVAWPMMGHNSFQLVE